MVASAEDLLGAAADSSITNFVLLPSARLALNGVAISISRPGQTVTVGGASSTATPALDGRGLSAILIISAQAVVIQNMALSGGAASGSSRGGAVQSWAPSTTLRNLVINGCFADLGGGSVFTSGNATLDNVTISSSRSVANPTSYGGGIFISRSAELTDVSFTDVQAIVRAPHRTFAKIAAESKDLDIRCAPACCRWAAVRTSWAMQI